jgi:transcriptional regulator with XRE-family HTH domain
MSQDDLGELMGSSQSHVSALECGTNLPHMATMQQLCAALGTQLTIHIDCTGIVTLIEG